MKLCDLETSKALQELGYDGECQYCHVNACDDGYETITVAQCKEYESDIDNQCPAPRLDDAAYWLRDKKGIQFWIIPYSTDYCAHVAPPLKHYNLGSCPDYDTALESAVKKAIKIIKEQEQ